MPRRRPPLCDLMEHQLFHKLAFPSLLPQIGGLLFSLLSPRTCLSLTMASTRSSTLDNDDVVSSPRDETNKASYYGNNNVKHSFGDCSVENALVSQTDGESCWMAVFPFLQSPIDTLSSTVNSFPPPTSRWTTNANSTGSAAANGGGGVVDHHQLSLPRTFATSTSSLHNLIPTHLQPSALAPSLHGTPGHPSALIPPVSLASLIASYNNKNKNNCSSTTGNVHALSNHQDRHEPSSESVEQTAALAAAAASNNSSLLIASAALSPDPVPLTVQDRPMTSPVYNGVNPNYPGLKVLHNSPPVFCVENFLTPHECDFLINEAHDAFGPAPVVGKGSGEISPSRTSSTCYLAREDLPDLLRKITLLTGKPMDHCELPQVGRYLPSQQYLQHYDAFDLSTEDGRRFAMNGGQRTITVLIYLNDVHRGGATRFPALNLDVQPVRGMALIFFPATIDGMLDQMALHAAMPAVDVKYVSQVWIRQGSYNGQPSKRLNRSMGVPFGQEHVVQARPPAPGPALFGNQGAAVGLANFSV